MMGCEFDSDDIKTVCEDHGVHYLNPARKHSSEKATCRRVRDSGKRVYVETQETIAGRNDPQWMYLPASNYDTFATDDIEENDEEAGYRQEIIDDFGAIIEADDSGYSPFDELVNELREEESIPSDTEAI